MEDGKLKSTKDANIIKNLFRWWLFSTSFEGNGVDANTADAASPPPHHKPDCGV